MIETFNQSFAGPSLTTKPINHRKTTNMKSLNLFKKLGMAIVCAVLMFASNSATAADIRANAGTTFTLTSTTDPSVFTHEINGVAQVSLLGKCTFHGDVVGRFPATAGQPIALTGNFTFTTADGATTLSAAVEGAATPDPANPSFLNFHYDVTFTGGSGAFTNARGRADIDGFGQYTAEGLVQPADGSTTGKATWTMKGEVRTKHRGKW